MLKRLCLIAVLAGCRATDSPVETSNGTRLTVVSGKSQVVFAGSDAPAPLALQLIDSLGEPAYLRDVDFVVVDGGGRLDETRVRTGFDGVARVHWKVGTAPGEQHVRATVADVNGTLSATFQAIVTTRLASVTGVDGGEQRGAVGARVAIPPAVRIVDDVGRGVGGVHVSFAVLSGGGSVDTLDAVTDTLGIARSGAWTLGPTLGTNQIEARVANMPPVRFAASSLDRFLARSVAVNARGGCALDLTGVPFCWDVDAPMPAPLATTLRFGSLASGNADRHTCALTTGGDAYCWGANDQGQLGDGTTDARTAPTRVAGTVKFNQLVVMATATCGVATGIVYCWGDNGLGQLGDRTTVNRPTPAPVAGTLRFRVISAGAAHTCGIAIQTRAYCWGRNNSGQTGTLGVMLECETGASQCVREPSPMPIDLGYAEITAGEMHTCGVTTAAFTYCWGRAAGFRGSEDSPIPQSENVPILHSLAAGDLMTCGLMSDDQAFCFGANVSGVLGFGFTIVAPGSGPIVGGYKFRTLIGGGLRVCAITWDSMLFCWGRGPVGDGSAVDRTTPTPVVRP
jgi:hypothetical protein